MKFGIMFDFEAPPQSDLEWHEPYQHMFDLLPEAEELGYESAFTASHHVREDGLCPAPLIAMAGAASVTDEMQLGTGILLIPYYKPTRLAEDTAVLDNLTDGRFILGVAPGYVTEEFEWHGVPRGERVGRMEESLDFLQRAWTEDRFSFDGKFYETPEAVMTPKPKQDPHPPIWYGVSGPKMLRRAAERRATQVYSPRSTKDEIKDQYEIYKEEVENVGWEIPETPIMRYGYVAEDYDTAVERAQPGIEHIFQSLYGAKSAEGDRVLRTDDGEVVTDVTSQAAWEKLNKRFIIGTPEMAIEQIEWYQDEVNCDHMIVWQHMPGIDRDIAMESVRLFADEVMPAFE